jgi:hypothetical protein
MAKMDKTHFPGRGFGTFWHGAALSGLERACLASFASRGYDVTLFSFEPIEGIPDGIRSADAAAIVSRDLASHFHYDGKPHVGHFSDIFRYRMIEKQGLAWIDMDVLLLSTDRVLEGRNIIPMEDDRTINGAIFYLDDAPLLERLIDETMKAVDRNLRWGETGPLLLTRVLSERMDRSDFAEPDLFYPVPYYDIYKVLLPECRNACVESCRNAVTLHLFNNILVKMGYWKDLAPPDGSFLHEKLLEGGLLRYFDGTYPADVMRNMLDNFRLRENGQALGIRSIVREFVPSMVRTYRHYHPKQA